MQGRFASKSRFLPVAFITAFFAVIFFMKAGYEAEALALGRFPDSFTIHAWLIVIPALIWCQVLGARSLIRGKDRTEAVILSLLMLAVVSLYLDNQTIPVVESNTLSRILEWLPFKTLAVSVSAPLLLHLLLVFPERRAFLKYGAAPFLVFLYLPLPLILVAVLLGKWPVLPVLPFSAPAMALVAVEYCIIPVIVFGLPNATKSLLGKSRGYVLMYGLLWGTGTCASLLFLLPRLGSDPPPVLAFLLLLPAAAPYFVFHAIFSYPHIDMRYVRGKAISGITIFIFITILLKFFQVDIAGLLPGIPLSKGFFIVVSSAVITGLFLPAWKSISLLTDRFFLGGEPGRRNDFLTLARKIPTMTGDLEQILETAAEGLEKTLNSRCVCIYTAGIGGDEYLLKGSAGEIPPDASTIKFSVTGTGLVRRFRSGPRFLELYNVENNPLLRHLSLEDKIKIKRLNAVIALPLVVDTGFLGMIFLGRSSRGTLYTKQQIEEAMELAGAIAVVVENTKSRARLQMEGWLSEEILQVREIKEHLLPGSVMKIPGFNYSSFHLSGKAVGGDFFDIFQKDESKWILTFCELPDNSRQAVLLASTLKAAMRSFYTSVKPELSTIVTRLNKVLLGMDLLDRPLPLFVVELKKRRRASLVYVNADYPNAYLVEPGAVKVLQRGGAALGSREVLTFQSERLPLHASSTLLLLSGGIFGKSSAHSGMENASKIEGADHLQLFLHTLRESGETDFDIFASRLKNYLYRLLEVRKSTIPVDVTMLLFRPEKQKQAVPPAP